jgi:hypothetical protein
MVCGLSWEEAKDGSPLGPAERDQALHICETRKPCRDGGSSRIYAGEGALQRSGKRELF